MKKQSNPSVIPPLISVSELAKEINNRKLTFKMGNMEFEGLGRFSVNTVHAFSKLGLEPESEMVDVEAVQETKAALG